MLNLKDTLGKHFCNRNIYLDAMKDGISLSSNNTSFGIAADKKLIKYLKQSGIKATVFCDELILVQDGTAYDVPMRTFKELGPVGYVNFNAMQVMNKKGK